MDTVVNPPQPGEPSYETWKTEVDTTIASLKRSGIYLPAAVPLDLAFHWILTVLRIREVYPGSPIRLFSIPDSNFFIPSRISIK
jgi:hypothetical protein